MDQIKIAIEQEHKGDSALFVQVFINGQGLSGILVVEEFFSLRPHKNGLIPLFTCGCGDFGCGGYYVSTSSSDTTLTLLNKYHRFNRSLQAEFVYNLDWPQVRGVAKEIVAYLQKLYEHNPEAYVTTGYGGENLLARLPDYRQSWLLTSKSLSENQHFRSS